VSPAPEEEIIPHLLWLPGERFEIGLDARLGEVTPPFSGPQVLMVTNQRAVLVNQQAGKKTTSLLPLTRLASVEVVDVSRPSARLVQGLLFLGTGLVLGLAVWTILEALLFVLVAGGAPALVGVYLLAAYLFPDERGDLLLHSGGHALRMPLLSDNARRDVYLVAHRLSELMAASPTGSTGQAAKASTPETAAPTGAKAAPEETAAAGLTTPPVEAPGEGSPPVPALPELSAGEAPTSSTERSPAA
jgi:hypothetical protein